jgi:hypothetical protein
MAAGETPPLFRLDHDPIRSDRIMISSPCLSMIFSENRFPLSRIMLQATRRADAFPKAYQYAPKALIKQLKATLTLI